MSLNPLSSLNPKKNDLGLKTKPTSSQASTRIIRLDFWNNQKYNYLNSRFQKTLEFHAEMTGPSSNTSDRTAATKEVKGIQTAKATSDAAKVLFDAFLSDKKIAISRATMAFSQAQESLQSLINLKKRPDANKHELNKKILFATAALCEIRCDLIRMQHKITPEQDLRLTQLLNDVTTAPTRNSKEQSLELANFCNEIIRNANKKKRSRGWRDKKISPT